jgi:hypothetical protein
MAVATPQYVYKIGNSFPLDLKSDEALPASDLDKVSWVVSLSGNVWAVEAVALTSIRTMDSFICQQQNKSLRRLAASSRVQSR